MKNSTVLLLMTGMLLFFQSLKSQEFLPFINDNYAGATGMVYNPSVIADSRYKFDMEFAALSNKIENNMVQLNRDYLFNWVRWTESDYLSGNLSPIIDGHMKQAALDMEARGLSFMASINDKSAFGLALRTRALLNFSDLPESAALLMFNQNDVDSLMTHHIFQDISFQAVSFGEIGLSYARVLIDNGKDHFLKAGITANYLQGIGSLYLYEKYLEYDLVDPDTATNVTADVRMGLTGNLEDLTSFKFAAKPSVAFDFGLTYEWRPKHQKYKYDMDGKKDMWRKDLNKYKLRIGLSLTDLGSMKFQKQYNSGNFSIDTPLVDLAKLHAASLVELADSVNKFYGTEGKNSYYKMKLPTSLNFNIDYHVYKSLYLNMAGRYAFNRGHKYIEKVHYFNVVSLTPRWESKWYGVSMPVSYNSFHAFKLGLGLRLGPIWVGSSDLMGVFGLQKTVMGTDVHVAAHIPIYYPTPKDWDGDLVSDEMDECNGSKGSWALRGCPDMDGDSIADKNDDCPGEPGPARFGGCPDSDGDGIMDKLDSCKTIAGLSEFHGCPDSDGDGIEDRFDRCPQEKGLAVFKGCPDMDADSIPDNLDDCPEVAGTKAFNGCPDSDGDGIRDVDDLCPTVAGLDSLKGCPYIDTDNDHIQDKYDRCPQVAGPIENHGCPYADTDNDSVPDKDDLCPMTPGPVSNNGCPVIEKAVQQILDTAFANLEFQTGKSIIKPSSFPSLDKVAEVLSSHPEFNLLISGHTDNVGREEANMSLSQNRALAVRNYLHNQGIDYKRLKAKWYGETRPIADNSTPEGRRKNRRVEMKIIFD